MTNQEVLTKAINKTVANGWKDGAGVDPRDLEKILKYDPLKLPITGLIFNHDFAKALWGEWVDSVGIGSQDFLEVGFRVGDAQGGVAEVPISELSYTIKAPQWQIRLMEMVIAPDPIKYLGEHL